MIPQAFLYLATAMITGAAFGAAVLISAPAIVAYLLLPTLWTRQVGNIHSAASRGHAGWTVRSHWRRWPGIR